MALHVTTLRIDDVRLLKNWNLSTEIKKIFQKYFGGRGKIENFNKKIKTFPKVPLRLKESKFFDPVGSIFEGRMVLGGAEKI